MAEIKVERAPSIFQRSDRVHAVRLCEQRIVPPGAERQTLAFAHATNVELDSKHFDVSMPAAKEHPQ